MARLVPNAYVFMVMTPDPTQWPGIADPLNITAADHAAHRERPGIPHPEDYGLNGKKHKGQIMKVMRKTMKPKHRPVKARRRRYE